MRSGTFHELQPPRPWGERSECQVLQDAPAQIELADGLGFGHAWRVELPALDAEAYRADAHRNEDIVRLTPEALEARTAAKERP